jgi:hypothetical protein
MKWSPRKETGWLPTESLIALALAVGVIACIVGVHL